MLGALDGSRDYKQQQGYWSVPCPCYGRSLLFRQIMLISVIILSMIFYVIILPILFYATILPYVACYYFPSLCYDISHALFHCIMLDGSCGLFFFFTPFQVHVKRRIKRLLAKHDGLGQMCTKLTRIKNFGSGCHLADLCLSNSCILLFGVYCIPLRNSLMGCK